MAKIDKPVTGGKSAKPVKEDTSSPVTHLREVAAEAVAPRRGPPPSKRIRPVSATTGCKITGIS